MNEDSYRIYVRLRWFRRVALVVGACLYLLLVLSQWTSSYWENAARATFMAFCLYPMFMATQVGFIRMLVGAGIVAYGKDFVLFMLAFGLLIGICLATEPNDLGMLGCVAASLIPMGMHWLAKDHGVIVDAFEKDRGKSTQTFHDA